MLTFFRGWKRKVGVMTLVGACVFMAGWARSLVIGDQVAFEIHRTSNYFLTDNYFLTSKNGCLRWSQYGVLSNGINPSYVNPSSIWTTVPLELPSEPFDEFKDASGYRSINTAFSYLQIIEIRNGFVGEHYWHRRWQWLQFDFGNGRAYGDAPMFVVVVPYWSIVIPLTLLSGWLLLSNARPKSVCPTEQKVAP